VLFYRVSRNGPQKYSFGCGMSDSPSVQWRWTANCSFNDRLVPLRYQELRSVSGSRWPRISYTASQAVRWL
jgi:hypothetical protein